MKIIIKCFPLPALVLTLFTSPAYSIDDKFYEKMEKMSIYELSSEAADVQNKAFRMFNRLNKDNYYDVPCNREYITGSRVSRSVCRPQFVGKVQLLFNSDLLGGFGTGSSGLMDNPVAVGGPDAPVGEINSASALDNPINENLNYGAEDSQGKMDAVSDDFKELANRIDTFRRQDTDFNEIFEQYDAYMDEIDRRGNQQAQ